MGEIVNVSLTKKLSNRVENYKTSEQLKLNLMITHLGNDLKIERTEFMIIFNFVA